MPITGILPAKTPAVHRLKKLLKKNFGYWKNTQKLCQHPILSILTWKTDYHYLFYFKWNKKSQILINRIWLRRRVMKS